MAEAGKTKSVRHPKRPVTTPLDGRRGTEPDAAGAAIPEHPALAAEIACSPGVAKGKSGEAARGSSKLCRKWSGVR